jgi:cytochrome c biogenesis protein CcmG/thiol:disulfide interchange protein DsbE
MSDTSTQPATSRRSFLMALPLIAFLGLAVLFLFRLGNGDPSRIPSALIGYPAPLTNLPPLTGLLNDGAQGARTRSRCFQRQGQRGQCLGFMVRALP